MEADRADRAIGDGVPSPYRALNCLDDFRRHVGPVKPVIHFAAKYDVRPQ
ncbi:MAG: hypothetical protein U0904_10910 [Candidatus Nanopelagicales bacterium]|nr:hypothetical protein [Candidatus Nanopelagicales bacterium]